MTNTRLRIPLHLLFAAVLATLIGVVVEAQQATPNDEKVEETKTGSITGTVVSDNGQPLAGAAVFVNAINSPGQGRSTTTDSEGNFRVNGLDPALYAVGSRLPAYVYPPRSPDELQQSGYHRVGDTVKLVLIRGGVITGTVTNSANEPVVSVGVRASLIRDANGQLAKPGFGQSGQRTTDDRGVYRIYGLVPGTYVVSAGGLGNQLNSYSVNAYDTDAPTYSPSSTRDTATEVSVRAGDETGGVDIRYRGEPGHIVSGTAIGPTGAGAYSAFSVMLATVSNGTTQWVSSTFQYAGSRGFSFSGVIDGDYVLSAQSLLGGGEITTSEPRPVKVRGTDVTGVELTTRQLPSIVGKVTLEPANATECKGKRRPLFAEMLIAATHNEKSQIAELVRLFAAQGTPDREGSFSLRNLQPGQYSFQPRFFAKYWYLQSLSLRPAAAPGAKTAANQPVDAARNWTTVRFGDRVGNLNVTLAEGAASLRGQITTAGGQTAPPRMLLYLVPAERDKGDEVLRFYATLASQDGDFSLNNLAPGRYWILARAKADIDSVTEAKLRRPDENALRSKLRHDSEAANTALELKPCESVTEFKLPLKLSPVAGTP